MSRYNLPPLLTSWYTKYAMRLFLPRPRPTRFRWPRPYWPLNKTVSSQTQNWQLTLYYTDLPVCYVRKTRSPCSPSTSFSVTDDKMWIMIFTVSGSEAQTDTIYSINQEGAVRESKENNMNTNVGFSQFRLFDNLLFIIWKSSLNLVLLSWKLYDVILLRTLMSSFYLKEVHAYRRSSKAKFK